MPARFTRMKLHVAKCLHRADAILAEGPVWDAVRQRLWWVDIEGRGVHCLDPAADDDRVWTVADRIGFALPTKGTDLVIGTERGLARFAPECGTLTPFANPERAISGNRFNDAKCDAAGRLWAGTMAVSEESGRGSLYRVDAALRVQRIVENVSISNGLAWSLDGRTMFYIDSPTRRVDAFDFDPASGAVANRRAVIEVADGFPDGMCIDGEGNLWVALWGGSGVACFDPRSGARLAKIEVPVKAVTSTASAATRGTSFSSRPPAAISMPQAVSDSHSPARSSSRNPAYRDRRRTFSRDEIQETNDVFHRCDDGAVVHQQSVPALGCASWSRRL